ncbi:hypothetical protein FJ970_28960 [Mesorhizobium sp. B2-1-8]|uniref:hypothetical protein n=1 Tax=Mesorhizobium sp. B2-1-8 TaxID=2589967 RepID=UPI001125F15B|nr:hypothetical protein [Mesorhizobium sp. B2-1-8]UCI19019.1 hypothetical protein FJ970_28960 [Mesorhizobium sp. B2-1-8]
MAQFWSVNHHKTASQEIDRQHLWSPKTKSNGARNEVYNNMGRATPGDRSIGYMGRIAEFAFTAPKPMEFGDTGTFWNHEGDFCRPFGYHIPSILPKSTTASLGPLLPRRYSPTQQSESLSDKLSTEEIHIENGGLIFQNQDDFEAGASLTVLKARILRDVQQ